MLVIHIEDGLVQGVYTDELYMNKVPITVVETTKNQDNDGDLFPSKTLGPFTIYEDYISVNNDVIQDVLNSNPGEN